VINPLIAVLSVTMVATLDCVVVVCLFSNDHLFDYPSSQHGGSGFDAPVDDRFFDYHSSRRFDDSSGRSNILIILCLGGMVVHAPVEDHLFNYPSSWSGGSGFDAQHAGGGFEFDAPVCWTNMRTRTKRTQGTENPDAFVLLNMIEYANGAESSSLFFYNQCVERQLCIVNQGYAIVTEQQ
jgi:hypothetical protein